ncbi:hypothetical protein TNIN_202821 [Trichonephila inaurata madagascariensis]|uniref:Uncharacterized protein n=1 Tax=Trichonephila inaurata madagascariensis TaxID=2747483 RepID=A0A8X6XEP3_9ARAC|nr:hypothetical protein TNIN_202821 [Trichonephila inaurata madagascariensis]
MHWIAEVKKSLNRQSRLNDQGSLRETRPANRRASYLDGTGNQTCRVEKRSESGRGNLFIGRAARLPLVERVARREI